MAEESFRVRLQEVLTTTRNVLLNDNWATKGRCLRLPIDEQSNPIATLCSLETYLKQTGKNVEACAIAEVINIATSSPDYGGMGLSRNEILSAKDGDELILLTSAWLESLNSAERRGGPIVPLASRPATRRPMNVTEKIFALHDVDQPGWVRTGDIIRVSVDWVMASEATWHGMLQAYNKLGDPGIFSNSRFWLAGDHVVDPRIMDTPLVQKLVGEMDFARKRFKMTEFQGHNYTIMHTEFYRERAQPGQIIIGSDSHTCSAGANGCLAVGLGATEVTMALVTGEIWFKVPEVVEIHLVGKPQRGVGGKDIILYILQQLKRNTVAADRVVEYTGPGCRWLSPDARFAIANMTTEFGGITGIFVPDEVTKNFIDSRKTARHKTTSYYFKPDEGCSYVESHIIDISKAQPFVARYPRPDDVVPVSELAGTQLDGVFIGACTTAEEDLIMGALVLQAGLDAGKKPVARGNRRVVPGSRPIADYLRNSGLADIYERAGFSIGVPGCSYCVGMGADMAKPGEVWLSSQNRNFENRMGKGAIGSLASAATVAASSFDMFVTSPSELVDAIADERWNSIKGKGSLPEGSLAQPQWVEPPGHDYNEEGEARHTQGSGSIGENSGVDGSSSRSGIIKSKVFRMGDFVDTDALAPAQYLLVSKNNEELGTHCLEHTIPEFRQKVQEGHQVVVAGKAFGCGSSRQESVQSLLGAGVKCVIAESFAFIYSRNQPSLGLWGFVIDDPQFYEKETMGKDIEIDLDNNLLTIDRVNFGFQLSQLEKKLTKLGGLTNAFNQFGKRVYDVLTGQKSPEKGLTKELKPKPTNDVMAW
ncbi:3-isopropylmalate dehydratase large subunit 2 [Colletotrichum truncatum]|uniref:3-isopropylmalate dehydratase large subunit 2 n=1 Tax=Colletotrichum truncatum TaxID=5467 RepID=A0ACC3Z852_COLTU|nr:3-isopropylmalate dehydratase large subunit 2 [Colletotrichum truncatum]KAF6783641.1 3-isopropylmalate dehydratase large subunit 2 [Colletotrichum truncatum]